MNASFIKARPSPCPSSSPRCPPGRWNARFPTCCRTPASSPRRNRKSANMAPRWPANDTGNAVGVIAQDLRKKYPGVTDAEITNFLVTAYCSELKAEGYDGGRARTRIKNFADRADRLVAEVN